MNDAASAQAPVVPEQRMDTRRTAPDTHAAMIALDAAIDFDPPLRELVKVRASLVNGCAYCIQLHTQDALSAGERPERLFALGAWDESSLFTARERAALEFTDAVTNVRESRVPDAVYERAAQEFEPPELAQLLFAVVAINAWNRLAIATRKLPPGTRA